MEFYVHRKYMESYFHTAGTKQLARLKNTSNAAVADLRCLLGDSSPEVLHSRNFE
jgi:hypothetical protein